jgi:hypothetical protein
MARLSFLWVGALLLPCFSHGQNVVQQWNHLVRDVLVENKIDLSNVSSPCCVQAMCCSSLDDLFAPSV